jgi:hypothetical protein
MNIKNLKKIKNTDKLKSRLPSLLKELSFFRKKLQTSTYNSKKHKTWSNKYNDTQEKISYISSKLPEFVTSVKYPKITQGQRGSGYSARELGVSPRQLRDNNVDILRCDELKKDINYFVGNNYEPQTIKEYVERNFYTE